jgi:transposase-like protein
MDTDVSDLCCVNSKCPDYGKRGAGNLVCRKLFGRERRRFVRCRTCRTEFSERRGTALFAVRTPTDKAISVLEHIADGCGVRQTARLTGVTTNTVMRLTKKGGAHAGATHDELARHLTANEVQLDEKWSFVGKKGRTVRPHRPGG